MKEHGSNGLGLTFLCILDVGSLMAVGEGYLDWRLSDEDLGRSSN